MGVDFYNCVLCNEITSDCAPHEWCPNCGFICDECMDDPKNHFEYSSCDCEDPEECECEPELIKCPKCEIPTTEEVIEYFLSKTGMTLKEVDEAIKNKEKKGS